IREYEKLFPPVVIHSGNINTATVYTLVKKNGDAKISIPEYTEVVFLFDKDGYVKRRIEFFGGKVNCSYDYGRDSLHRITKETFNYVDSAWKSLAGFPSVIKDYSYNEKGLLEKIKQEGPKGEILADDRTMTDLFQYDEKGRQTYERYFMYYEGKEPNSHEVKTKFFDPQPHSGTITLENGKPRSYTEISYSEWGKPLSSVRSEYASDTKQLEEWWTYDDKLRILKYTSISHTKSSECPEKETFNEEYVYASNGLLSLVKHSFALGSCEMRVEYK
ncbi:MAG TPA: hypothetical protein VI112_00615, partial [Bacteroidia bacterium]